MQLGNDDRSNVEDRRGLRGFGGGGLRLGLGGTLVLAVLSLVFGRDLLSTTQVADQVPAPPASSQQVERRKATEADLESIAVSTFNDAQSLWTRALGDRYRPAKLVLFWDGTRSACGDAPAAMGPFYCPLDQRVYIDLGFYRELARRFGAAGDFANAYVIAHEVGHHVQNVLGIADRVRAAEQRRPDERNALSVRMELQADCLAGVWARSMNARGRLDPGDVDEALQAAAAVGDDRIQRATGNTVHPERFTHGSAQQRSSWFRRGFDAAAVDACDTFRGDDAPPQARRPPER